MKRGAGGQVGTITTMRLICPNCDAQYEVDDSAIPEDGRDVQCSACGHAWFQSHPGAGAAAGATDPAPGGPPAAAPGAPAAAAGAPRATADDDEAEADGGATAVAATEGQRSPRSSLDANLLAILKEEAEREVAARKAEARAIETQADLGLMPPEPPAAADLAAAHAGHERTPRRDLLPDIEEINSTLRPGAEGREGDPVVEPTPPVARRGALRTAFLAVVTAAAILAVLYLFAPQIGRAVPALAEPMARFVAGMHMVMATVDGAMARAAELLRGLTGA
jgi:predicted Zn finger-like uncharacterized protein